jgi:hypothetical protein
MREHIRNQANRNKWLEFRHNGVPAGCQNLLTLQQTNKHLDAARCYKHEETKGSSFSIISDQFDHSPIYGFSKESWLIY